MGTRADFYVGEGVEAEWLGSIAWDGYLSGIPKEVLGAKTEAEWRERVEEFFAGRRNGDATRAADGWPWPWEDSCTTDCAYSFVGGEVRATTWGGALVSIEQARSYEDSEDGWPDGKGEWPNMKSRASLAAPGTKRSGILVVGIPG